MKKYTKKDLLNYTISALITLLFVLFIVVNLGMSKYYFFPVFITIYYLVFKVVNSKLLNNNFHFKRAIVFFIISFLLVFAHSDRLFYQNSFISLTPDKSQINNLTNEVWVCKLNSLNSNIDIVQSAEWVYKDDCWVYIGVNNSPLVINPKFNTSINLLFVSHNYSSAVNIATDTESEYIDLYSKDSSSKSINIITSSSFSISNIIIFKIILLILTLTILLYILSLYDFKLTNTIIMAMIISNVLYLTMQDKIMAMILCAVYMSCAYIFINHGYKLFNLFSKLEKILLFIITFCINFLSFGSFLFLNSAIIPFEFSLSTIILFMHTFIIIFGILFSILYLFDYIQEKFINKNGMVVKTNYIYFIISFCSLLILAIAFYPGNLSSDSISQLYDALRGTISDAHPAIMTIILGMLVKLTGNVFSYIIFQDLFFALMLSKIFNYLGRKGLNKKLLIILSIIIPLIPNIGLISTTVWKDIIYSISLTLLSYYVFRIVIKDDMDIYNFMDIILFIVAFVFTKEFRHNGLAPFLLVSILLFILSIVRKNKDLLIMICSSILISTIGVNLLYNVYDVKHQSLGGSVYNSIVRNFAATLYYDKELSDDAYELIKPIGNVEHFKNYYRPTNIDYLFYSGDNSVDKWFETVNNYKITKVLPIYLKNIIKNPDVFIRDRYDSMAIMLDASYSNRYNDISTYYDGIYTLTNPEFAKEMFGDMASSSDYGYVANNMLVKVIRIISEYTTYKNLILSQICWKSGVFFIGYLILFFYLIFKKKPLFILGMTPIIGNTLSWFLVLNHPSVRYVYYLNMSFIFMLLLSLVAIKEAKK